MFSNVVKQTEFYAKNPQVPSLLNAEKCIFDYCYNTMLYSCGTQQKKEPGTKWGLQWGKSYEVHVYLTTQQTHNVMGTFLKGP